MCHFGYLGLVTFLTWHSWKRAHEVMLKGPPVKPESINNELEVCRFNCFGLDSCSYLFRFWKIRWHRFRNEMGPADMMR